MRRTYFWGILFIVIGVGAVVKEFVEINLPTSTIIFSAIFIVWGISILTGNYMPHERRRHRHRDSEDTAFTKSESRGYAMQEKYDVIFGDRTIDLTTLNLPEKNRNIKIDTIFARSYVKINPQIPALIKVNAVFAGAYLPNKTNISFGEYTYTTKSFNQAVPYYYIKVDVVFGQTDIVEV
ncbi:MAG: hypothetical protein H7Y18_09425 [Clostridiaceae bacterium]|nr:hypothetical protein [Clostridiaceae bacterium]